MHRTVLTVLLLSGVLAGCGGGGSPPPQPPPQAPGLAGLQNAIDAAHGAVTQSQKDAQRASSTSAGQ